MTEKIISDADETETDLTGGPFIPPSTVWRQNNKEKLMVTNSKCEDVDLFIKHSRSVRQHGLTTPEHITFLKHSVCMRDKANNVIARKEEIDIIIELCDAKHT